MTHYHVRPSSVSRVSRTSSMPFSTAAAAVAARMRMTRCTPSCSTATLSRGTDASFLKLYPGITPSRAADEFTRGDNLPDTRQFSYAEFDDWEERVVTKRAVQWRDAPRDIVSDGVVHVYTDDLELYSCQNCDAQSAVLRRCALCREARYCDRAWCVCLSREVVLLALTVSACCSQSQAPWKSGHPEECGRYLM